MGERLLFHFLCKSVFIRVHQWLSCRFEGDSLCCMTTKNPFPGMNPFFEQEWRSAHTSLVVYLGDALQERLPPDLRVRPEGEEVVTIGVGGPGKTYRPGVKVCEPWTPKEPSATEAPTRPPETPGTEPIRVVLDQETERWLEIRDDKGRLITVIELLSPSNKLESTGRDDYLRKCRDFISGGANLVEIDLIRKGAWVFPQAVRDVLQHAGACYAVSVFRAARRREQEVYPIGLRQRLPCIRVPLRPADADVVADLQPLVDQCHERGRYHFLEYRLAPEPPLAPEDAAWANQLLREHQLL